MIHFKLSISQRYWIILLIFYSSLGYLLVDLLWGSQVQFLLLIILPLYLNELRQLKRHIGHSSGDLIWIPTTQEFYWQKRRFVCRAPALILPTMVVIYLHSRSGQQQTLILFIDQLDRASWRKLCYYLQLNAN